MVEPPVGDSLLVVYVNARLYTDLRWIGDDRDEGTTSAASLASLTLN